MPNVLAILIVRVGIDCIHDWYLSNFRKEGFSRDMYIDYFGQ